MFDIGYLDFDEIESSISTVDRGITYMSIDFSLTELPYYHGLEDKTVNFFDFIKKYEKENIKKLNKLKNYIKENKDKGIYLFMHDGEYFFINAPYDIKSDNMTEAYAPHIAAALLVMQIFKENKIEIQVNNKDEADGLKELYKMVYNDNIDISYKND